MSVANFGAFLGGMAQGQQSAEAQRERAAYLALIQKRQSDADADKATTDQATFDNDFQAGQDGSLLGPNADVAKVFGAGAAPLAPATPSTPPAPQPGQASVPMQGPGPQGPQGGPPQQMPQPGAQPMPVPQQGQPQPRPLPPQAGPAPGGPPPQGQPPQGPQGPQAGPQAGPPQQAGAPGDMFQKALQTLEQAKAELSTPVAQKVLQDPEVQKSTKAYHDYVKELSGQGIGPGKGKPDAVQMKRLRLYHDQLAVSMADASKHITTDRTEQDKIATQMAATYAKWQSSENILKGREDAISGKGDKNTARPMDGMNPDEKALVESYISAFQRDKKFPTGTGYNDPYKKTALMEMQKRGMDINAGITNKALDTANTGSVKGLQGRLGIINETGSALEGLEPKIIEAAKKVAALPGMSKSARFNEIAEAAQTKYAGNGDVQNLLALMQAWKSGYARLVAQNTGAGGSPVFALSKSDEIASGAMPVSQMEGAFKAAGTERKVGSSALQKEIDRQTKQMQDRGKPGAAGANVTIKAGDSVPRAKLQAAADAAGKGETVEQFATRKGLQVGE